MKAYCVTKVDHLFIGVGASSTRHGRSSTTHGTRNRRGAAATASGDLGFYASSVAAGARSPFGVRQRRIAPQGSPSDVAAEARHGGDRLSPACIRREQRVRGLGGRSCCKAAAFSGPASIDTERADSRRQSATMAPH
jgi:hypothetical protein